MLPLTTSLHIHYTHTPRCFPYEWFDLYLRTLPGFIGIALQSRLRYNAIGRRSIVLRRQMIERGHAERGFFKEQSAAAKTNSLVIVYSGRKLYVGSARKLAAALDAAGASGAHASG